MPAPFRPRLAVLFFPLRCPLVLFTPLRLTLFVVELYPFSLAPSYYRQVALLKVTSRFPVPLLRDMPHQAPPFLKCSLGNAKRLGLRTHLFGHQIWFPLLEPDD